MINVIIFTANASWGVNISEPDRTLNNMYVSFIIRNWNTRLLKDPFSPLWAVLQKSSFGFLRVESVFDIEFMITCANHTQGKFLMVDHTQRCHSSVSNSW